MTGSNPIMVPKGLANTSLEPTAFNTIPLEAMTRINREAMGFTPVPEKVSIRLEWGPRHGYDAMLHMHGKTARTVAFRRIESGYEWIGEQEIFEGPKRYRTPDGEFNESITITFDKVPISGHPVATIAVDYAGEEPELTWPRQLSLEIVRPWLKRWGFYQERYNYEV